MMTTPSAPDASHRSSRSPRILAANPTVKNLQTNIMLHFSQLEDEQEKLQKELDALPEEIELQTKARLDELRLKYDGQRVEVEKSVQEKIQILAGTEAFKMSSSEEQQSELKKMKAWGAIMMKRLSLSFKDEKKTVKAVVKDSFSGREGQLKEKLTSLSEERKLLKAQVDSLLSEKPDTTPSLSEQLPRQQSRSSVKTAAGTAIDAITTRSNLESASGESGAASRDLLRSVPGYSSSAISRHHDLPATPLASSPDSSGIRRSTRHSLLWKQEKALSEDSHKDAFPRSPRNRDNVNSRQAATGNSRSANSAIRKTDPVMETVAELRGSMEDFTGRGTNELQREDSAPLRPKETSSSVSRVSKSPLSRPSTNVSPRLNISSSQGKQLAANIVVSRRNSKTQDENALMKPESSSSDRPLVGGDAANDDNSKNKSTVSVDNYPRDGVTTEVSSNAGDARRETIISVKSAKSDRKKLQKMVREQQRSAELQSQLEALTLAAEEKLRVLETLKARAAAEEENFRSRLLALRRRCAASTLVRFRKRLIARRLALRKVREDCSARAIQRSYRAALARAELFWMAEESRNIRRVHGAATTIQKLVRGTLARKHFKTLVEHAISSLRRRAGTIIALSILHWIARKKLLLRRLENMHGSILRVALVRRQEWIAAANKSRFIRDSRKYPILILRKDHAIPGLTDQLTRSAMEQHRLEQYLGETPAKAVQSMRRMLTLHSASRSSRFLISSKEVSNASDGESIRDSQESTKKQAKSSVKPFVSNDAVVNKPSQSPLKKEELAASSKLSNDPLAEKSKLALSELRKHQQRMVQRSLKANSEME